MKETATKYYKSRQGNCAQSVAIAWAIKNNENVEITESFSKYGSGKAPEGTCGALYAAYTLSEDKQQLLKDEFTTFSNGFTTCREIRKDKQMSCVNCVEVAAALLEKYKGK